MRSLHGVLRIIWFVAVWIPISQAASVDPGICGLVVKMEGYIHTNDVNIGPTNTFRHSNDWEGLNSSNTMDSQEYIRLLQSSSSSSTLDSFLLIVKDEDIFSTTLSILSRMINVPMEVQNGPFCVPFHPTVPISPVCSESFTTSVKIGKILLKDPSGIHPNDCQPLWQFIESALDPLDPLNLHLSGWTKVAWFSSNGTDRVISDTLRTALFSNIQNFPHPIHLLTHQDRFLNPIPVSYGHILYVLAHDIPKRSGLKPNDIQESHVLTHFPFINADNETDPKSIPVSMGTFQQVYWVSVVMVFVLIISVWLLFSIDPGRDNVVYRMSERQIAMASAS